MVQSPQAATWRGRRVLVTGHTGFKGGWLARWLVAAGAEVHGLALDPEEGAAGGVLAVGLAGDHRVDLRDEDDVTAAVAAADPEVVLHLAAQPIVAVGYRDPVGTYATNVQGTVHLLDALRDREALRAVLVVTSDKVYRHVDGRRYREGDELGHDDPYANSKALVELLVRGWRASYLDDAGVRVATARAGNVIGGGDPSPARLVPDALRAAGEDEPLRLRRPLATRPWQHVVEPLSGYLLLAEGLLRDGAAPPAVNFGPPPADQVTVEEVIDRLARQLARSGGEQLRWERAADATMVEAPDLQLDSSLAAAALGWQPRLELDEALAWTVDWWRTERSGGDLVALADRQWSSYLEHAARPAPE